MTEKGMKVVQPIRDPEKIKAMKAFLKRKSYRDFFMFEMGINTGLRISDILKLKVSDVKAKDHITIIEKKTSKSKRFRLNAVLKEEIAEYIQGMNDDDYLFPSTKTKGKPIDRVQAYRILNEAAAEVGIKENIGTHTLRKTFGYFVYKQHKDVAVLQKIFNHSAPSITLRYIGIEQDEIDQVYEGFHI